MIGDFFGIYLFGCIVFVSSSSEESNISHILDIDETRQFTIEDIEEGLLKLHEARMGMDAIYRHYLNSSELSSSVTDYNRHRREAEAFLEGIDTNDKCVDLLCSKLPNEKFTAKEVKKQFKEIIFDILCKAREAILKNRCDFIFPTNENILKFVDSILQLRVIFAGNLESNEISNYLYQNLMIQLKNITALYTNFIRDDVMEDLINRFSCFQRESINCRTDIRKFCHTYLNYDRYSVRKFIAEDLNSFLEISTYLERIQYLFHGFDRYKTKIEKLQDNIIQADSYSIPGCKKYLRRLALRCKIILEDSYAQIYIMRVSIYLESNKIYINTMKSSIKTFFISILKRFKDALLEYSLILEQTNDLQSDEKLKYRVKFLINEVNSNSTRIIEEYEKSENMEYFEIGRINSVIIELAVVFDGLDGIGRYLKYVKDPTDNN